MATKTKASKAVKKTASKKAVKAAKPSGSQ